MLQTLGDSLKNKKYLAWLVLVPLVLVFAIWGATGAVSLDFMGAQSYAAKVNGNRIDSARANQLWQRELSDWQQETGGDLTDDVRQLLQDQLLERLVIGELISSRSNELGYRVPARVVVETVQAEPAFQVDGRYSETLALARLAQVGATPESYLTDVRRDLQNRELQRTIFLSEFATPIEVGRYLALQNEQRELAYAVVPVARFRNDLRLTDSDLATWFEQNRERFRVAESVKLRYFTLSLADVGSTISVSEADLQQYYAENKERYEELERRRARHILLTSESEAEQVLADLRAGADFAVLAERRSKDTGSASLGGDLGLSDRSAFVTPFAEAVFSMAPGELRGPVKSEFGYHVIRLDEVQTGRIKSLDEVRSEIAEVVANERASDLLSEQLARIERQVESGSNFSQLVDEFALKPIEIEKYARGDAASSGLSDAFETVVFSDAVLNQRRIGGPVEIDEQRIAFVELIEHRKSFLPELAAVRQQVLLEASREALERRALQFVESLSGKINAGESFAAVTRGAGLSANNPAFVDRRDPSVPAGIRNAAFETRRPASGQPVAGVARLDADSVAVFVTTQWRSIPPTDDSPLRMLTGRSMVAAQGEASLSAYVSDMRSKAKVERNAQAFQ